MAFTKSPDASLLSAHARYAAHAAAGLGYGFRSLDGADGYLFEVADGARRATFAAGAGSPYALNDARAASLARDKAFCAIALREARLPTPPGEMFFVTERWAEMRAPGREPGDARAYARAAHFPLFCKPIAGSNGVYAEVIADIEGFEDFLARVAREHFAILIQPYLNGAEYRVFVLNGKALFAYRKLPPRVTGDGCTPLRDLLVDVPRDYAPPLDRMRARRADGGLLALDDAPAAGESVTIEGPANLAAGGGASAPVTDVPAPLASLAEAAARTLGLGLAGVDMFDLSAPADLSDLTVIEVNSNPMIRTLEQHGRWDLIDTIWRANFAVALR